MDDKQPNNPQTEVLPTGDFQRLENLYGFLPRTTGEPDWTPSSKLQNQFAIDTTNNVFYFYDFDDNVWASTAIPIIGRFELKIIDDATVLTTGDGKLIFMVPAYLNGLNLTAAHAFVTTVSSSGLPTIQIRNVTAAVDMLTTKITIDATEFTSYTAATPPVIDTGNDGVAAGDRIAIDVDVAGTGAKGLGVYLEFS